ncbi:methylmalonyl-CoA mutase subunit beta [uncultured Croceitalea sp.]|uniref:methylmalonyl-CoA mutase subunit beta n=1 Tax=uncultured Croceitalea sp. TaxID=1798908 RepID=UPI003305943B
MKEDFIFSEFPEVSAKAWKQKIQVDLKGADYNQALVWESLEGIAVKPFYHAEDTAQIPAFSLPQKHSWSIGQRIYVTTEKTANEKANDVIGRGAENICFAISNASINWSALFDGIDLNNIAIYLHLDFLDIRPIHELLPIFEGVQKQCFLSVDIIGNFARTGNWFYNKEKDHQILEELIALCNAQPGINILSVDASLYQNAGANSVQQLAYALAHANEYLNHFTDNPSKAIHGSIPITFKVSIGNNYFFEIAKLRALRWLWQSLAVSYDFKNECHIIAQPGKRNKTIYDYNVNMLRTTSECMSAVLGGANTVVNLTYDALYQKDNEFGERIARNQLLLLKEESYFDEALRAAEGSYYIESLTKQLAEKALELFKQIEATGGFLSQLKNGSIQKKIKENAAKEQALFDTGDLVLLGTNTFQNADDCMKENLEIYPFTKMDKRKTQIEPILEKRLAEALEQKRLNDE